MNSSTTSNLFDQLPHGYRMDRRFGPVFDQAPAGADDLTLIRGIETREAVLLNRIGIYFLAQIALWEHRESSAFADELGMQASALAQEQWVQQAQVLCRPQPGNDTRNLSQHRPASLFRTTALICCALLIGCLLVYWLNLNSDPPMRGVLSADITSLRVPSESKLVTVLVEPGQEVFSGEALMTLEKTEHLAMIELQEERVEDLKHQLDQAEAQAALDLAWRSRELERELSDVRQQAQLIQEVQRAESEPYRAASADNSGQRTPVSDSHTRTVSRARVYERPTLLPRPNTMIFIGASGQSSVGVTSEEPLSIPVQTAPQPVRLASEPASETLLSVESRTVDARLERLEELREILPQQVRRAAGVETVRVQFDEASQRLTEMKLLSREIAVLSPGYGKVGQIRYKAGDTMSSGEIMLKILHSDRRYVIIHVPTRRVNEITPGMVVGLVFPGDDRYRGKVANLPMLAESARPGDQTLVTVRVEPTGRLWPEIPIGSQIDVVISGPSVF